ncbi:MAG TPA: DUF192 domain-containing protein [archaeon]|nr:DUF192 domain-containing protein [archaeon]
MEQSNMFIKSLVFASLFFAVLSTSMCISSSVTQVTINNATVSVEVASTPEKMEKGLMGREFLSEKNGMLFIFPDEKKRSFWMKNTLIPLDIIFISKDMKVVDVKQNFLPCRFILCSSYTSKESAMYALEVNANFTQKYNISAGNAVKFS